MVFQFKHNVSLKYKEENGFYMRFSFDLLDLDEKKRKQRRAAQRKRKNQQRLTYAILLGLAGIIAAYFAFAPAEIIPDRDGVPSHRAEPHVRQLVPDLER